MSNPMNHRDELLELLEEHGMQSPLFNASCADAILSAGYRKPDVIAYMVSRDGDLIGKPFSDREAAQTSADEWTAEFAEIGWYYRVTEIGWYYRVAEIVEATK